MKYFIGKGFTIIVIIGILGFILYPVFLSTFKLFDKPTKTVLFQECDREGLRKATLYKVPSNATSNPSLQMEIGECSDYKNERKASLIFVADKPNLSDNDLEFKWSSFDTLIIELDKELRIFTKEQKVSYPDSTLDLTIVYETKK